MRSMQVNVGWTGDKPDLVGKLREALDQDVDPHQAPNKPGKYTFVIVTEKSASEVGTALERAGIEDVSI